MPLPTRFESYRGFVITPYSVGAENGRWTIGAFIRVEVDSSAAEESCHDKGHFAASHDEAIKLGMAYGKKVIDDRLTK